MAFGDLDRDGDLDVLVAQTQGKANPGSARELLAKRLGG